MDRRKALTFAGVVTAVLATGSVAMAANLGLLGLGSSGDGTLGKLDARNVAELVTPSSAEDQQDAKSKPKVVVIEEVVEDPAPAITASPPPASSGAPSAPLQPPLATPYDYYEDTELEDGDDGEDWEETEHGEDASEHEDEHEDEEEEEHEGEDDDD